MCSSGRLINITSDDDSDEDIVTDYTSAVEDKINYIVSTHEISPVEYLLDNNSYSAAYPKADMKLNSDDCKLKSNNMVPLISVTPHSPGSKYNILEDTLNHLQSFRENVIQMKSSSPLNKHKKFILPDMNASKLFSSCPSLQDLSVHNNNFYWPKHNINVRKENHDRRKSWTAIEDLSECAKQSHKSLSLSSLDSEEPIMLRTSKNISNRGNRNSTGGISTHSLNEAELVSDFERIIAKQSYNHLECLEQTSHVPLQKSISTPSIVAIRSKNLKEDNTALSGHLSDSEDELRDENHLGVRDKNSEDYSDTTGKRRKRGSLFFRKKKDKTKNKSITCEACGSTINMVSYKDHIAECKVKIAKKFVQTQQIKLHSGKKIANNSHNASHHDEANRDFYDGHSQNDHSNCSDDVPLMRDEFLNETPVGPHDLGAEPILGLAIDEFDSWSPSVPREVQKSLKDKQVKRQEHIYEFIMTEKHHCQTLLVMQKVIVESLEKHFSHSILERMFPRLVELTDLHTNFLKKLRLKQRECYIVDSIADILLDFFSSLSAQKLKNAYGEFCSNHRSALDTFKFLSEDQTFSEWYKHCQQNPLLKKKGIPECILFVTQRLTKYPLLIDPLMKSSRDDKIEQDKLQKAMSLVKEILIEVDARVADKEKEDRQLDIFKRIDAKSFSLFKNKKFKKSDIVSDNRKLKFEGVATLMQGRSKMLTVLVVVLSDCLFFLLENSQKYTFFTPENKAGVVTLQKLLIREKAGTESRSIYIISSNPNYPEMFELKVQSPKDKNIWIQTIRAAVIECPTNEIENEDIVKRKQKLIREIMSKMRQKDCEQAILLEEKVSLQLRLLLDNPNDTENIDIETFFSNYGSYRDLITDDCDTIEIWKRVLSTVQEISHLASTLYTAATGLPLSRSYSSVGERQSDVYISPTLPKRAETFGGFDERRIKTGIIPSRDAVLSTLSAGYFSNREHNEKRNSNASDFNPNSILTNSPNSVKSSTDNLKNDIINDNYAALQVSHHLHTILCIVSQQMTTIQSLQHQLNNYRDNPKASYRHNDQLEELRNLQDKLQEEKTLWLKQKEHQEQKLEEQSKAQKLLQEQIRLEQEDIKQQREQLYRKMEILSNQGLLLSPSVALPLPVSNNATSMSSDDIHLIDDQSNDSIGNNSSIDRRKDKWRTASISKSPPLNLVSATNASKNIQTSVKQQLPLKLSSMASTKSLGNNSPVSSTSQSHNASAGVTQMFPLKLADKKAQPIVPNHTRTGSSPAIVQQQIPISSGNPATRTNTYPKIPERFRLKSADGVQNSASPTLYNEGQSQQRSVSVHSTLRTPVSSRNSYLLKNNNSEEATTDENTLAGDEKVIYF